MAEGPSNPNPPIVEPQYPIHEFSFFMKPIKILKHAFQAFSDPKFNPLQLAVIQVGDRGCEIVVWTFNVDTGSDGYGYLGLKAAGLEGFHCMNNFRRAFSLEGIAMLLKSAENLDNDNDSVFVYAVQGSNQLSFDFGNGFPINIDLKQVGALVEQIPDCISYGFEAVIRSSVLRKMSEKLQRQATAAARCPETVEVTLKPAAIAISTGNNVIASSVVLQDQAHRILTDWQNWNSLQSASFTAKKASVYLVTKPFIGIMVRFHLEELGDLVYLHPAAFKSAVPDLPVPPELPLLGHFRSLLGDFSMY